MNFSGRSWLGVKRHNDEHGRVVVDPFEDEAADKMAVALGFERRLPGDFGTTILIVDADVNLADMVVGVEDWWWPRLIEHKLDVEVFNPDGSSMVPRPKRNEQLRPFIEAFDIARARAEPKSGAQKLNTLSRLGETALGVCGLVVVPLRDDGQPLVRADRCNTVALIRAPFMVVAYKSFSETAPMVVGAFMASEEVDLALKKSEPPAHDRWDPDSTNLRDEKGTGKEIVRAVLARIKSGLKRFQGEAAPPAPAKQRRLSLLERALGAYFKPHGSGPNQPPEPVSSALHLEFTKQPFAEATPEGMLRLRSAFTITMEPSSEDESVELRLEVKCPVIEDEGQEGDDLELKIQVEGVEVVFDAEQPRLCRFELLKGTKAHFAIESEPYDIAWTVRLRPEFEEESAQ